MQISTSQQSTPALPAMLIGLALVLASQGQASAYSAKHYVPPITNAVINETPYITTEVRPIYMYNWIPSSFVTGGGHINMWAVQLRAALTERLGLIATKDGYADIHFKSVLPDEEGFANVAAGLKYAVVADEDSNTYVSVGGRYELPIGHIETAGIDLQGTGDGFVDLFVTGASTVAGGTGFQASAGFNVALDNDNDSSLFHTSVHADHELIDGLFGVLEANLITTIDEGSRTDSSAVGSFEGFDLVNFGSTNSGTVVTLGLGGRYHLTDRVQFGAAYEFPLTDREDIISQRLTFDMIFTL